MTPQGVLSLPLGTSRDAEILGETARLLLELSGMG
jgi:hypothetical protein